MKDKNDMIEHKQVEQNSNDIDNLNKMCLIEINHPISSHHRIIGPFIVLGKKIVRKIINLTLGWYIRPILKSQTDFNLAMLNAFTNYKELVKEKMKFYDEKVRECQESINACGNNINACQESINACGNNINACQESINACQDNINICQESIESCVDIIKDYYEKLIVCKDTIKENQNSINTCQGNVDKCQENINKCQGNVDRCQENIDKCQEKLDVYRSSLQIYDNSINKLNKYQEYILNKLNVNCDIDLLNVDFDYFAFEVQFRGSREGIMEKQKQFIKFFKENKNGKILDIGCGRGEFLEVMQQENIEAFGIDIYKPFVDYCLGRGFDVKNQDALTYITSLPDNSLGGVFMDSVIEHLEDDYILALISNVYKKLKTGCYFIITSPNPETFGGLHNFNIDLEHKKPIHYLTLEYLLKNERFIEVNRYETPESDFNAKVCKIEGIDFVNKKEFNKGMDEINKYVFGNREYVAIAKK